MELWVRSQDRECLMKVDRVDYDYSATLHRIVANGYKVLIGKYPTKERALEVLDEIQNKFKIICTDSTGGEYILAKNLIPIFYEMPKE